MTIHLMRILTYDIINYDPPPAATVKERLMRRTNLKRTLFGGFSPARLVFVCLTLLALVGCAAEAEPEAGGITGRVYLDEDADRHCDVCDCDFYMDGVTVILYRERWAGTQMQEVKTDEDGSFTISGLEPGQYCVSPKVKLLCEGFQPTTPITQVVTVNAGEVVEAPWFGFDHHLDVNP